MSDDTAGASGFQYTLVVGEDTSDRAWLESVLQRGGLEVAACTEAQLMTMPDLVPPHLVLLDDASSLQERRATFANLKAHPQLAGVPFVVLAYDTDIDSFSDAITHGASAYLVKPAPAEDVVAAAHKISGWLRSADRTEKRRRLRRPLLMRVDLETKARPLKVLGQIIDVSGGGCRVEVGEPLARGEAVRLTLHGIEGSTEFRLNAEVRWHRTAPPGMHVLGLRFTGSAAIMAGRLLGTAPPRFGSSG